MLPQHVSSPGRRIAALALVVALLALLVGIAQQPAAAAGPDLDSELQCHLTIAKSATTSYTRTWNWTIHKTVSPEQLNLFAGDSAEVGYTVSVQKTGPSNSDFVVSGLITITNDSGKTAYIDSITDKITIGSTQIDVPVSGCPTPMTLPDDQRVVCSYSKTLTGVNPTTKGSNKVTVATHGPVSGGSATANFDFSKAKVTEVGKSIDVADSNPGVGPWHFEASGQVTYGKEFECPSNQSAYRNGLLSWYHENTAYIEGAGQSDKAGVLVNCYAPVVSKTAQTSYTRTYNWTISKSATPAVWNLFRNDSATSRYTVSVQKSGYTDSAWKVVGAITVYNPSLMPLKIASVTDYVSGVGLASVNCGVSFPYTLAAERSLQCTYSLDLPDGQNRVNTATATLGNQTYPQTDLDELAIVAGGPQFSGTANVVFGAPTTEVNKSVTVTDSNPAFGGPYEISSGQEWTYSRTFTCDQDKGTHGNTARIVETEQSANASVTVNCYALSASKTAQTTYTRTYHWSITKAVSPAVWNLFRGDSGVSHYTVNVQKTGYTDSGWAVNGTVSVYNPAPVAATINNVNDVVSGVGAASLNCGVAFPYELGAGQTLQCTYSKSLPDAVSRTNTATATQQNYSYAWNGQATAAGTTDASGSASVVFGAPTTEVNKTVTVTDTNGAFGGPYQAADSVQWQYARTFACDQDKGVHGNTARIVETEQSANASVTVNCYAPSVSKTAETFLTRTYGWTISKSASQRSFLLYSTQSATTQYTVSLTKDGGADSDWTVAGKITIQNPAPMPATLTEVLDAVSGGINAAVFCHNGMVVPANGSLDCIYLTDLPNGNNRTNTATVKLQNYDYDEGQATEAGTTSFSASTGVSFANATVVLVNDKVHVTDSYAGSGSPWLFSASGIKQYNRTFTCDQDGGQHNNTATIVETGQMAQESVLVTCMPLGSPACTSVHTDYRTPQLNQIINIEGRAVSGNGPFSIVAYKFIFGDGSETDWLPVANWQGNAWTTHAYAHPGVYPLSFLVRLQDGQILGGAGTRCALPVEVKVTPPPTIVVPTPVCGQQPIVTIMNIIDTGRRLQMTGLSRDNAIVDIQIKGPNDADFMTNGRTTADAFGQWSYTSSVLGQDGTYQVRALSGGQLSDNTVVYTLRSGPSILRTAMYRMGLAGYAGVRDTYISEQTPLLSFSTGVTMSVRSGTAMEPLARFDLSSIPANARVVMAKVGLYSLDAEPCTNVAVPVYQVRAQWDATTNWISPTVGSGWLVPGARSAVSDRVEPATYTQTVRAPFTWYDWDITPMVQQWVSNPSTNHGLIADTALGGQVVKLAVNNLDQPSVTLTMEDLVNALGGRRDFASSEYQELRRRPILFVTYVIP